MDLIISNCLLKFVVAKLAIGPRIMNRKYIGTFKSLSDNLGMQTKIVPRKTSKKSCVPLPARNFNSLKSFGGVVF